MEQLMFLRIAWLFVACCLFACSSTKPEMQTQESPGIAMSPPYKAPTITTLSSSASQLVVTFRSDSGVDIAEKKPALLLTGDKQVKCPLVSGPARSMEPGGKVVDRAHYIIDNAYRKLLMSDRSKLAIAIHDGVQYWQYPYISGDILYQMQKRK
jgi:hypothetical protein